jgi:hypothetical protein
MNHKLSAVALATGSLCIANNVLASPALGLAVNSAAVRDFHGDDLAERWAFDQGWIGSDRALPRTSNLPRVRLRHLRAKTFAPVRDGATGVELVTIDVVANGSAKPLRTQ